MECGRIGSSSVQLQNSVIMLNKISGIVFFAIGAIASTYVMGAWWVQFGTHEAYPYIMTCIAAIMWWLVYLQTKEED